MTLPIVAYGHPVLRKVAQDIPLDYPDLDKLLEDMSETMYKTEGVGLAAPQINRSIRLFIVDATPFVKDYPESEGFKRVFINPYILERKGEEYAFNEGCLSLPDINEEVYRKSSVLIEHETRDGEIVEEWIEGINARIVQHEYDHLEGHLFTDHVKGIRKIMIKGTLANIAKGNVRTRYKMIFKNNKR